MPYTTTTHPPYGRRPTRPGYVRSALPSGIMLLNPLPQIGQLIVRRTMNRQLRHPRTKQPLLTKSLRGYSVTNLPVLLVDGHDLLVEQRQRVPHLVATDIDILNNAPAIRGSSYPRLRGRFLPLQGFLLTRCARHINIFFKSTINTILSQINQLVGPIQQLMGLFYNTKTNVRLGRREQVLNLRNLTDELLVP